MVVRSRLNDVERWQDRARITSLYVRGWTMNAIAIELGLSRDTVSHDLRRVKEEWQKGALFDMNVAKQREMAKIDEIEREAWMAYEKSKAPRDITTTRQRRRGKVNGSVENMQDQTTEANKRTEQRDPNPVFLQIALECSERRSKLQALYPPAEARISTQFTQITEVSYEAAVGDDSRSRLVVIGPSRVLPSGNGHSDEPIPELDEQVDEQVEPELNGA